MTREALDRAAGTSDMGGWWASTLPHRSQIPTPDQWAKLRKAFSPPARFDAGVRTQVYRKRGDCRSFIVGDRDKPPHPSPKPLDVMRWVMGWTPPDAVILDPFGGSGTTAVAALHEGRRCIIVEKDAEHCEVARRRVAEAMGVGAGSLLKGWEQGALFDEEGV